MMFRVEFEEQVWAQVVDMLLDQPGKKCIMIVSMIQQQISEQRPPEGPRGGNGSVLVQPESAIR